MEIKKANQQEIDALKSRWRTTQGKVKINMILAERFFLIDNQRVEVSENQSLITDLRGIDLSAKNLEDAMLCEVDLRWANFRGAYIARSPIQYADLTSIDFNEASLYVVNFWLSKLENATFCSAHLCKTYFTHSEMQNVSFKGATLDQVGFEHVDLTTTNFENVKFESCSMYGAILRIEDREFWENLSESECHLQATKWRGADGAP